MILASTLSMPGCTSWNGRWSGEGKLYAKTRTFSTLTTIAKAKALAETGYYRYSFGDGWVAGVSVKQVDAAEARRINKASQGFFGYDWMIESLIRTGKIESEASR